MSLVKRNNGPRGPRFYDEGDKLIFLNVLDGSTRFGPREATDADRAEHPKAYEDYLTHGASAVFPGAPVVAFKDPPGGKPPREIGPNEQRRERSRERSGQ